MQNFFDCGFAWVAVNLSLVAVDDAPRTGTEGNGVRKVFFEPTSEASRAAAKRSLMRIAVPRQGRGRGTALRVYPDRLLMLIEPRSDE